MLGGKTGNRKRTNATKIYAYARVQSIEKIQYQYRIVIFRKRGRYEYYIQKRGDYLIPNLYLENEKY